MDSRSTVTTVVSSMLNLKRQKSNQVEDIIGNLPEQIIIRILSCLPIRDAVRTSVLSKSWICRWTRVTKLELNDKMFYFRKRKIGKQRFINIMNKILFLTSNSSVESFHLILISNKYDQSVVNTWISSILCRDVKKLNIRTNFDFAFSVVSSHLLFNTYYLEELVLDMHGYCCAIRVSKSYVYFRHLKFLHLSGITFTIDLPSDLKDVSLDFPVLKEFKTKSCNWLSVKCVTLKVPLLERFVIEHGNFVQCHVLRNCVVNNCAINICASRMTEFTCGGCLLQDIFLLDPSSAKGVAANITLYICKAELLEEAEVRACKLLNQFSQAKCLKLGATTLLAKLKSLTALPQFEMLSHLEYDYFNCETLLGLLHKSPFLKTLVIKGLVQFDREILNSAAVPNCLLSTLEVVKFGGVQGCDHELWLAKFLVENALLLKKMSISLFQSRWGEPKTIDEFKEKLISFKKVAGGWFGTAYNVHEFNFLYRARGSRSTSYILFWLRM